MLNGVNVIITYSILEYAVFQAGKRGEERAREKKEHGDRHDRYVTQTTAFCQSIFAMGMINWTEIGHNLNAHVYLTAKRHRKLFKTCYIHWIIFEWFGFWPFTNRNHSKTIVRLLSFKMINDDTEHGPSDICVIGQMFDLVANG